MDITTVKMHVFLDVCYEVECTAAVLYNVFAKLFSDDIRISRMWRKTSMEEENHARHVLLAQKMVQSISWINIESWRNALRILGMTQEIINSAQKKPPTLKEALSMALECETRLECLHMENAILVKEKVGNSMFKALSRADQGHILMLQSILDELQMQADEEFELIEIEELFPLEPLLAE